MADNQDCSKMLEFKPFPRLATELQLNIWKLAIPEPRIISVKVTYIGRNEFVLSTNAKNPGVLFACKIAREATLSQLSEFLDLGTKHTRFDPTNDTICFYELLGNAPYIWLQADIPGQRGPLVQGCNHMFSGVQRLLISLDFAIQVERILSEFPNIKNLIVAWENFKELQTLDIDSLRVRGALDVNTMEDTTFKKWIEHQSGFDSNLSGMKTMLGRINKARGEANHVEVSWMRLYN